MGETGDCLKIKTSIRYYLNCFVLFVVVCALVDLGYGGMFYTFPWLYMHNIHDIPVSATPILVMTPLFFFWWLFSKNGMTFREEGILYREGLILKKSFKYGEVKEIRILNRPLGIYSIWFVSSENKVLPSRFATLMIGARSKDLMAGILGDRLPGVPIIETEYWDKKYHLIPALFLLALLPVVVMHIDLYRDPKLRTMPESLDKAVSKLPAVPKVDIGNDVISFKVPEQYRRNSFTNKKIELRDEKSRAIIVIDYGFSDYGATVNRAIIDSWFGVLALKIKKDHFISKNLKLYEFKYGKGFGFVHLYDFKDHKAYAIDINFSDLLSLMYVMKLEDEKTDMFPLISSIAQTTELLVGKDYLLENGYLKEEPASKWKY